MEGDVAVMFLGENDRSVVWPVEFLPVGAEEGDVLQVSMHVDEEVTRARRDRARHRIQRLRSSGGRTGDGRR